MELVDGMERRLNRANPVLLTFHLQPRNRHSRSHQTQDCASIRDRRAIDATGADAKPVMADFVLFFNSSYARHG